MIADVPLGAFLSGGIDSSLVVALMQEQSATRFERSRSGSTNPEYNEADHAAAVARHLGTDHHEQTCGDEEMLDVVDRLPDDVRRAVRRLVGGSDLSSCRRSRANGSPSRCPATAATSCSLGYPRYRLHCECRVGAARCRVPCAGRQPSAPASMPTRRLRRIADVLRSDETRSRTRGSSRGGVRTRSSRLTGSRRPMPRSTPTRSHGPPSVPRGRPAGLARPRLVPARRHPDEGRSRVDGGRASKCARRCSIIASSSLPRAAAVAEAARPDDEVAAAAAARISACRGSSSIVRRWASACRSATGSAGRCASGWTTIVGGSRSRGSRARPDAGAATVGAISRPGQPHRTDLLWQMFTLVAWAREAPGAGARRRSRRCPDACRADRVAAMPCVLRVAASQPGRATASTRIVCSARTATRSGRSSTASRASSTCRTTTCAAGRRRASATSGPTSTTGAVGRDQLQRLLRRRGSLIADEASSCSTPAAAWDAMPGRSRRMPAASSPLDFSRAIDQAARNVGDAAERRLRPGRSARAAARRRTRSISSIRSACCITSPIPSARSRAWCRSCAPAAGCASICTGSATAGRGALLALATAARAVTTRMPFPAAARRLLAPQRRPARRRRSAVPRAVGARRAGARRLAAVRLLEVSVQRALQRSVRSIFGADREALRPRRRAAAARGARGCATSRFVPASAGSRTASSLPPA